MSGKVYAIMSAVPSNGAKYVAVNLAKSMKRNEKKESPKRILLIDFDFNNPCLAYEFVKHDIDHGLDNLVPHLNRSSVKREIFCENVIQTSLGVDVLRGTQFIGKPKQFAKIHIETILGEARETYDIIIVVITPKANNAGTVYTLIHADQIILVLRNNYSNYIQFDSALRIIEHYTHVGEVLLIFNMNNTMSKADFSEKFKDRSLEVKVIGVLEYDEKSIDNLDLGKKETFLSSKSINAKTFVEIGKQLV